MAGIHINNMNELEKALQPVMMGLVNQMANEVYETLNYFLNDYYTGWTPSSYRRTKDFLYSAVKTEAKMAGSKCVASVYIDYESMDDYVNATGGIRWPHGQILAYMEAYLSITNRMCGMIRWIIVLITVAC